MLRHFTSSYLTYPSNVTVSAVVYSRNEARLLQPCLDALTGFDEVLVCDMESSDDTVEVARAVGARIVDVPDARVIEEVRQLGLDAAQSDWVLFIDADEILPARFADHVRAMIASAERDGTVAFRLRYTNVAFDRELQHTLMGSAKFSLMRRRAAYYAHPRRAHRPPQFDGPVRDAPPTTPPILHLNFRSVEQMVEKTLRYAPDLPADDKLLKPTGLVRELLRETVFSGTWRDGYAGTAVATSSVVGRWYGALLAAQQRELLTSDHPPAELRRVAALTRAHAASIRLRDGFGRILRGHRAAHPHADTDSKS